MFIDDNESITGKVDVYAYAFKTYEMLTFKLEFDSKRPIRSPQQIMMNICRGNRPKRSDAIPDKYWDLIVMRWQQDPIYRPIFEHITRLLRSDESGIEEFGEKSDLNALHEYWDGINPADDGTPINSNISSMSNQF